MTRVTVVTPTLNAATYFEACLRSVELQRADLDVEHIVVDDGSTDGTLDQAERSGAQIIDGKRAGLYAAMNQGLAAASGEYVGVLNGDDYLYPRAVATLVTAMQHTDRPWAIGRLRWVDGTGASLGELAPPPARAPTKVLASLRWNWMHHQTTYMRTDFWHVLGGFDTSYDVSADFDLLLRARRKSRFAPVNELTAAFRRHGSNLSITGPTSDMEGARISQTYGPHSSGVREAARLAARVYINARNPRWSVIKRTAHRRATT
ncbi:MAG TPA: glycosyltransferase family 2 protein [Acidothermaceae bacterium]|jgi:glycosyltransferase involved in cell wall biosynthesis